MTIENSSYKLEISASEMGCIVRSLNASYLESTAEIMKLNESGEKPSVIAARESQLREIEHLGREMAEYAGIRFVEYTEHVRKGVKNE